jgi:hypothetical protein
MSDVLKQRLEDEIDQQLYGTTEVPVLYERTYSESFTRRIYDEPCMTCTDEDCPGWLCEVLEPALPPGIGEPPEDPEALKVYEVSCSLYKALWQVHYIIQAQEPDEFGTIHQELKNMRNSDVLGPYLMTAIRFYGLWRVFGWRHIRDKILVAYSGAAKEHLRNLASDLAGEMEV